MLCVWEGFFLPFLFFDMFVHVCVCVHTGVMCERAHVKMHVLMLLFSIYAEVECMDSLQQDQLTQLGIPSLIIRTKAWLFSQQLVILRAMPYPVNR